jgi:hypothetical protein
MDNKINWSTLLGTVGTLITLGGIAIGFTWNNVILPEINKEIKQEFLDEKSYINLHIDERVKFVKENKTYTLSHKLSEQMGVEVKYVHQELGLSYSYLVDTVIPFIRKYKPLLQEESTMLDLGHKVIKENNRELWLDYDGHYYPVRIEIGSHDRVKRRYYIDSDNIARYISY